MGSKSEGKEKRCGPVYHGPKKQGGTIKVRRQYKENYQTERCEVSDKKCTKRG